MDSISEARLKEVCPSLASAIRQLAVMLREENIIIRVTQGLRSWSQQDALHAQGRTAPGPKVTNCPGGYSYHNFGMAVDVCPDLFPDDDKFTPDWNTSHPAWKRIVDVGESLGMNSGALWRTRPDWPHLQLNGRFPEGGPNDEVRQIFRAAGMEAVWKEAGIQE